MTPNPYQPYAPPPSAKPPVPNRRMFVLAGVGALLASAYWAFLTLLIGVGVASGQVSGIRVFLPLVLIVLYAVRGMQLFKGDARAARGILALHVIGAVMAVVQMASGNPMIIALQGVKLLIHVFGGVTAHLARKSIGG